VDANLISFGLIEIDGRRFDPRRAFDLVRDEILEIEVASRPAWLLADAREQHSGGGGPRAKSRAVRLLGAFDPYLSGYRNRASSCLRGSRTASTPAAAGFIPWWSSTAR
jgi:hypothetical protein